MFLDSHNLYGVVSVGFNAGKHLILELGVGAHTLTLLRHANVAFVDEQRLGIGYKAFHFPFIWSFRSPHLSREYLGFLILHHTCSVCRNAHTGTPFPTHNHLI